MIILTMAYIEWMQCFEKHDTWRPQSRLDSVMSPAVIAIPHIEMKSKLSISNIAQ